MGDDEARLNPMTEIRGVGSRPITFNTKNVKATTLGGTIEKLEMGMTGIYSGCRPEPCYRIEPTLSTKMNETLGQSYSNLPVRTVTWRDPKSTIHNQIEGPHRGGRLDPRKDWTATMSRPYTRFTVTTQAKHVLRTQRHTSSTYHGLMFSIRAGGKPIRITKLHTASGGKPRRELYRVYLKYGHFLDGVIDPSKWREVASGETELPTPPNVYGEIPWPFEGVKVQPGEMISIYIHCPYNQQGVVFRKFAKSWPGYPAIDAPTDKDNHLSILVARATYSQTPFERLSKEGYAFTGLVEYEVIQPTEAEIFVSGAPTDTAIASPVAKTKKSARSKSSER